MKKSKILKKTVFIFGIIVITVLFFLNRDLIKTTVITSNSGKIPESSLEENANNYTLVESKDGYKVPVPTGYTASSVESEMYVNGLDEVHTGTKTELTFSSDYDYPWTQNEDGVWVSGNAGVVSSESVLTSNEFTVGPDGGRLTVDWSVSCEDHSIFSYLYTEITNIKTGETIRSSNLSGTWYGTSYSDLIYTTYEEDLEEGTYIVSIIYYKSSSTSTAGLDSGYVKSANVISYDDTGTDSVTVHKYGGFVIYEGEGEVTSDNVYQEQTTRNQWVWVPVDSETVDRIYNESSSGTKTGQSYTYSITGRTLASTSIEPNILTNYDNEYYFTRYGLSGMTRESFYQELQTEFENTIESIKKYGGFYIGRYETGDLSQSIPVVKKMNIDLQSGTWYSIYSKITYLGANDYVKTNIIWDCLWDETLQWIVDSGSLKQDELVVSISWGNYVDSSITYITTSETIATTSIGGTTLIPSGSSEYTNVNNIYDLAGNMHEMTFGRSTISGYGGYYRIYRGGAYSSYSNRFPAYGRNVASPNVTGTSCRAYLYIQ